jgi:glycosyltransferase involved in cell wall biosynthesis
MRSILWLSVIIGAYPYTGYPIILWLVLAIKGREGAPSAVASVAATQSPPFTMIIAAHNEALTLPKKIKETLEALEADPRNELLIISDHSTDQTVEVVSDLRHAQIRVAENTKGRGRASAHNCAAQQARNEVLIFSDADTVVPTATIRAMVCTLARSRVGCVNAEIVFNTSSADEVARAAGLYWRFEMWLRAAETDLGLYATASGPCMGLRRSLFKELPPTGDVDFTSPIDVIAQGYRCVHLRGWTAFDSMPANAAAEFKVRVRMVSKNFSGTIVRWGLRNVVKRPLYSWSIYSHKVLRWLTPFFLLGSLLSNLALAGSTLIYDVILLGQLAFYAAALAGWFAYYRRRRWPVVQQVYCFVLANCAFAIGVAKSVTGKAPSFSKPTRQLLK